MAQLSVRTLGRYKIEICFAELSLKSGPSSKSYGQSVNFLDPFKTGCVVSNAIHPVVIFKFKNTNLFLKNLPEQFEYWPPLIIKHIDCSSKKEVILGAIMISKPNIFYVTDPTVELNIVTSENGKYIQLIII